MSEKFVIVFRTRNEILATQLQDILTQEGIETALFGPKLGSAHLEIGVSAQKLRIEVPASKAERAVEIIEAFSADVTDDGPKDEDGLPWELTDDEEE